MDKEKSKPVVLVISLPRSADGIALKDAIQKMATSNSRSMSNQVTCILRDHLLKEGLL